MRRARRWTVGVPTVAAESSMQSIHEGLQEGFYGGIVLSEEFVDARLEKSVASPGVAAMTATDSENENDFTVDALGLRWGIGLNRRRTSTLRPSWTLPRTKGRLAAFFPAPARAATMSGRGLGVWKEIAVRARLSNWAIACAEMACSIRFTR